MWLKILQAVLVVARSTGLDDKVKNWVSKKLDKIIQKGDTVVKEAKKVKIENDLS